MHPSFTHVEIKASAKRVIYTLLGINEDGTREVLSVVSHPTEGALLWGHELEALKDRGVESFLLT